MNSKPGPARSGRSDKACMSHSVSTRMEGHTGKRMIQGANQNVQGTVRMSSC